MQLLRRMTVASMSLVMLILAGCEGSIDTNNPPTMELDCYELAVTGGGGNIFIYYAVTNPVKNGVPEVKANVDWITPGEITDTDIALHIAASDINEERYGIVTIDYPGMKSAVKVYITQDKQLLNKFSFKVSEITYKSCTVEYMPLDKNRTYMANIIDAEYFKQSGITDGSLFVAAEMESYLALAQRNNMTLEELMSRVSPQLIYTGDAKRTFVGMQPGATYTIYSYGIEFDGNSYTMTTPLHSTIVDIPMPELYDITFGINVITAGGSVNISITPENWNGYYAVQVAPEDSLQYVQPNEPLTEYHIKGFATNFYTRARTAMKSGITAEQYLRSNCYVGNQTLNVQLSPDKDYMIVVFAVDSKDGEIPVMRSMPSIKHI